MSNPFLNKIVSIVLITVLFACNTNRIISATDKTSTSDTRNILTGFNQNWRYLPPPDNPAFINNIRKLSPAIIRYPGGTVTHEWDWRTGKTRSYKPKDFIHPLADLKKLVDETGVKIIFDLDVVNRTVEDQIAMLDSASSLGVGVEFIELGNEIYSAIHGYETKFPDGTAYADTVNSWVPKLRHAYPNAKIAALLIGKKTNKPRQITWNEEVTKGIKDIDAFTYHIYIGPDQNFESRKTLFLAAYLNPAKKPIWFTEYGNMNSSTTPGYLTELTKLADYVETFPGVAISLNHCLVTNRTDRTKLVHPTGNTFSAEGEMFLKRVQSEK